MVVPANAQATAEASETRLAAAVHVPAADRLRDLAGGLLAGIALITTVAAVLYVVFR